MKRVLSLLQLGQEELEGLRALTEVADGDARALERLLGIASAVELLKTGPLGKNLALLDGDNVDVVLLAQSLDQLLVARIVAVLGKDAKVSDAAVKAASNLGEAANETVHLERLAEDDAEGILDSGGRLIDNNSWSSNFLGHLFFAWSLRLSTKDVVRIKQQKRASCHSLIYGTRLW